MVDPDAQRVLLQILASWVLFVVFTLSAVAFLLVIFGFLKPDKGTKAYLFGLFSVSGVGLLVGAASDFLRVDPKRATEAIVRDAEREAAAATVQPNSSPAGSVGRITVYTQIGQTQDRGQYSSIARTLAGSKFILPSPEIMNRKIDRSEVRYCNPQNAEDAKALKELLESKGFNTVHTSRIQRCDVTKNRNILELWVQSSA